MVPMFIRDVIEVVVVAVAVFKDDDQPVDFTPGV